MPSLQSRLERPSPALLGPSPSFEYSVDCCLFFLAKEFAVVNLEQ